MTLQQRIKASAQELIRLLEESEKEHQDFIKERDARLAGIEPGTKDYVLARPLGFIIEPDISIDLLIEEGTRNIVGVDIYYPDGTDVRLNERRFHDLIQASAELRESSLDNGKPFTHKANHKDPSKPKADAQEECSTKKSYYITSLCKLFDKVSYPDILDILDSFKDAVRDGSFYFNK